MITHRLSRLFLLVMTTAISFYVGQAANAQGDPADREADVIRTKQHLAAAIRGDNDFSRAKAAMYNALKHGDGLTPRILDNLVQAYVFHGGRLSTSQAQAIIGSTTTQYKEERHLYLGSEAKGKPMEVRLAQLLLPGFINEPLDMVTELAQGMKNPEMVERQRSANNQKTAVLLGRSETVLRLAQTMGKIDPDLGNVIKDVTENSNPNLGIDALLPVNSWGKNEEELIATVPFKEGTDDERKLLLRLTEEVGKLRKAVQASHRGRTNAPAKSPDEERQLQTTIRDVRAMTYALHNLGLLVKNPETRKAIADTVEVASYVTTVSELVGNAGELSTLALTGNLVGATLGLIGYFSDNGGKTADVLILEELAEVKNMIADLHNEMREGFATLNEKLDNLYVNMEYCLVAIREGTAILNDGLGRLQTAITAMDATLFRIESSLEIYFRETQLRDTDSTVTKLLRRSRRFEGKDLVKFDEYLGAVEKLLELGTGQLSRGPIFNGGTRNLPNLQGASSELERSAVVSETAGKESAIAAAASAMERLGYIRELTRAVRRNDHALLAPAATRIPNVACWLYSCSAYVQLARTFPEFAIRDKPQVINEFIRAGEEINGCYLEVTANETIKQLVAAFSEQVGALAKEMADDSVRIWGAGEPTESDMWQCGLAEMTNAPIANRPIGKIWYEGRDRSSTVTIEVPEGARTFVPTYIKYAERIGYGSVEYRAAPRISEPVPLLGQPDWTFTTSLSGFWQCPVSGQYAVPYMGKSYDKEYKTKPSKDAMALFQELRSEWLAKVSSPSDARGLITEAMRRGGEKEMAFVAGNIPLHRWIQRNRVADGLTSALRGSNNVNRLSYESRINQLAGATELLRRVLLLRTESPGSFGDRALTTFAFELPNRNWRHAVDLLAAPPSCIEYPADQFATTAIDYLRLNPLAWSCFKDMAGRDKGFAKRVYLRETPPFNIAFKMTGKGRNVGVVGENGFGRFMFMDLNRAVFDFAFGSLNGELLTRHREDIGHMVAANHFDGIPSRLDGAIDRQLTHSTHHEVAGHYVVLHLLSELNTLRTCKPQ